MKMQEVEREYQCCNVRCGHRFLVKSDPEQGNVLEIPVREQEGAVSTLLMPMLLRLFLLLACWALRETKVD